MDLNTVLQEIESSENKQRKTISLAETEIYNDKIDTHVEAYLRKLYSEKTIQEMPWISCINLTKRIVDQEASLYKKAPERVFNGLSEQQKETIEQVYKDIGVDLVLLRSNRYFKLQGQNHIQILPFKGKLRARVLANHHIDAIPSSDNPEVADGYVISAFDKSEVLTRPKSDNYNQSIADRDDYKASTKKYAVWTKEINTIVNGKGESLILDSSNPLQMIPIVEIAGFKDFAYWCERGTAVTDFTIQFNATMSDLSHIVRMQGFAQAYLKGPADLIPENIQVGPNFILRLPIDPNNPIQPDFGFANPSPDLNGSLRLPEVLLSAFLTSRGLSPKVITTNGDAERYTSGLDRLLSMVDQFSASQFDMELYRSAEEQLLKIIIQYLNTYAGKVDGLNYRWSTLNPDSASVSVMYAEPEMIQTEAEKLSNIREKKELGLMSELDAIKEFYGMSDDEAQEKLALINQETTTELNG